nr:tetratricopeptide repeat protein [Solitalea koreensis]
MNRFYHNNTARYNSFFNAREIYRKNIEKYEQDYAFQYGALLPIIILPDENATQSLGTPMDEIIKKCSNVVDRHKVSKWVDDSYMMLGKAYFYKGDYFNAAQTFQYVYNTFPDKNLKEEAVAWIGLAKMKDKLTDEAASAFDMALGNIGDAISSKSFVHAASAEFYKQNKDYEKAAQYLDKAVASLKKVDTEKKIRYSFTLGQLYEKINANDKAIEAFKQIEKLKAPYEIDLVAKINIFRLSNITDGGKTDDLVEKLNKLLSDEKNKDYKGSIYYVLGAATLRRNDVDSALKLYKLSIKNSQDNFNQKALSYSQIGDIYFNNLKDYKQAKLYYDSTRAFIQTDNPEYSKIIERHNKLNELIENQRVINREDSLQRIALMPENQRNELIEKRVTSILETQRQAKTVGQEQPYYNTVQVDRFNSQGSAIWYFYNNNAVASGYNEFVRRWGNRTLSDNWRIGSQQQFAGMNIQGNAPIDDFSTLKDAKPNDIKTYLLKNIPLTPTMLDSSNMRKQTACYNLGNIYFTDLEEYNEAITYYSLALNLTPTAQYQAELLYDIYKSYELLGNNTLASDYRNKLFSQFPNSTYATAIKEPGKKNNATDASQKAFEDQYELAYIDFQNNQFDKVLEGNTQFQISTASDYLKSKYAFLAALAIGKTQNLNKFEPELKKIKINYNDYEVSREASQLLAMIDSNRDEYMARSVALDLTSVATSNNATDVTRRLAEQQQSEGERIAREQAEAERLSYFKKPAPNAKFLFIISVNNTTANLNRTRYGINHFNMDNYPDKKYQYNTIVLNKETQLISVTQFNDLATAGEYYKRFVANRSSITPLEDDKYDVFIITTDNFARLTNQQNVIQYVNYFRNNF